MHVCLCIRAFLTLQEGKLRAQALERRENCTLSPGRGQTSPDGRGQGLVVFLRAQRFLVLTSSPSFEKGLWFWRRRKPGTCEMCSRVAGRERNWAVTFPLHASRAGQGGPGWAPRREFTATCAEARGPGQGHWGLQWLRTGKKLGAEQTETPERSQRLPTQGSGGAVHPQNQTSNEGFDSLS